MTTNKPKFSIKFYLKEANSENPTLIILKITAKNSVSRLSTRLKILPSNWDNVSSSAKTRTKIAETNLENKILNDKLTIIFNKANAVCSKYYSEKVFHKLIKDELTKFINPKKHIKDSDSDMSLLNMLSLYIQYKDFSKGTMIKKLNYLKNYLMEFDGKINFDSVSQLKHRDFYYFLLTTKQHSPNTAKWYLTRLNQYLLWVELNYPDIIINRSYKLFKMPSTEKQFNVYLTKEEWQSIMNLKEIKPHLINSRHILNIMFYTGLRVSDACNLGTQHIDLVNKLITITQQKTGNKVIIPITHHIEESIELLLNNQLEVITSYWLSQEFKTLGKLAGIDSDVEIIINKISTTRITKPKYELLSCHTQRRSFIMGLLNSGVEHTEAMKYSGHKSLSSFEKYIAFKAPTNINKIRDVLNSW